MEEGDAAVKRIAVGNTAGIFEWKKNRICKLFREGYPREYVQHEFDNAVAVYEAGIRTPRAFEIVCVEGRNGIIYERITGQTLLERMNQTNGAELAAWTERFAAMHKALLSHHSEAVVDYKAYLRLFAAGSPELLARIEELADGDCLLHGDFHPGNVMVNEEGQLVLIDMMNICRGPAVYDVARTCFLLEGSGPLGERYPELMGFGRKELEPWLEVISLLREKERNI